MVVDSTMEKLRQAILSEVPEGAEAKKEAALRSMALKLYSLEVGAMFEASSSEKQEEFDLDRFFRNMGQG